MDIDRLRRYCLSLPHTTEQIQWEDHLVFKVGGKMYAMASLEPGPTWLFFKCSVEEFAELAEQPGIIPAPYLARAHWVALTSHDALSRAELERRLRRSHELVFSKLPRKTRELLGARSAGKARRPASSRPKGKPVRRRNLP
jgi:predicted DNA-binding protein (MmcQ/YjbR family)